MIKSMLPEHLPLPDPHPTKDKMLKRDPIEIHQMLKQIHKLWLDTDNIKKYYDSNLIKQYVENANLTGIGMGLELLELKRGHIKVKIPLNVNTNHVSIMYAGAMAGIA